MRAPTSPDPDRRTSSARTALAALVLVLAAVLVGLLAPSAQAAAPSAPTSTTTTSTQNVGPRLGWAQDTVYVENHASGRWPVRTAATRLGAGTPLELVLVSRCPVRTSSAQPAVQCIRVTSGDLGGGTLAGTTDWTFVKSTNKLSTVTVELNDRWAGHASYADRLNIAEHELGHGVGLPHVKRTSSIMNAVAHGRTKPDAGDLRDLDARY